MIDLTNAPEGTTGYYTGPTSISFYNGNKYWHDHHNKWIDSVNGEEWHSLNVISLQSEWTIYNNDKPLHELTDEQRGLIVNHWCNGGDTQFFNGVEFIGKTSEIAAINRKAIYRAKQKTERELFIDEWSSKITTNEYNGGNVRLLVGQMFDDVNGK